MNYHDRVIIQGERMFCKFVPLISIHKHSAVTTLPNVFANHCLFRNFQAWGVAISHLLSSLLYGNVSFIVQLFSVGFGLQVGGELFVV